MRTHIIVALLVAFAPLAMAGDAADLSPKIPTAKGEQCVEPTEIMRREHMNFILHQRDLTVHDGIRTEKHQFTRCINCHVQPDEQGVYPRHTSSEHFCTTCHEFASVSMDCFQCHADRPANAFAVPAQSLHTDPAAFAKRLADLGSDNK